LIFLVVVGKSLQPLFILGLVALVCVFIVVEDLFQSGQLSASQD